jgi:hypothetical protein
MYGSLILGLINIVALYLISHHKPLTGWGLNLAVQIPMAGYDIVTHQLGFLILCASTVGVALKSWKTVQESR